MSDGQITFSTALDNSQLEKDLKQAERDVDSLKRKVERSGSERSAIAEQMKQAQDEVGKTEQRLRELGERLRELDALAETDPTGAGARAEVVTEEFVEQAKLYDKQLGAADKLKAKWEESDARCRQYTADLERASARQAKLGSDYAAAMRASSPAVTDAVRRASSQFDAIGAKITKTMRKVFVFAFITRAVKSLKSYIGDALAENEQFMASWAGLRAIIQGVAGYVAGVLGPVLTGFVNIVAAMITTLANMVDSIFKTNIAASIEHARAAAKATNAQTKATRNLSKATKEANRQLMSFDEINAMAADSSGGAADAIEPDAGAAAGPDWGAFDAGKIDAKLAEIMLILGAALLAVGAVLCFSGINIPLGLTLMAIGALMLYTAYQEQWDQLPAEVRNAITGMLVLTGIILVLLGAVLAFASPATAPVGIGMMFAGAALLWTAVALNWESMPAEMKQVVDLLMILLGGALLVIGAILCFSGGGTPLGVGLMVAGAATLGGVVAINWDEMPEEVKKTVTTIMEILGGALLVIGAILALSAPATGPVAMLGVGLMFAGAALLGTALALNWNSIPDTVKPVVTALLTIIGGALIAVGGILLFSGAALPLGIGLLAAGAASLGAAAALNWDTMRKNVSSAVSTILKIVGGALLVIGIILLVTGVGIPLGIGLILAGAASLAASMNPDWNFLVNKVKEVWGAIKRFWKDNIAKIFTVKWWEDVFKSVANGLISALNWALGGVGDFLDSLTGGISDVLSWLGVEGWSFSISVPQIPYLAQGAVIPPNRKFLAVLGDQASGNNLEAPEGLLRRIVREEAGGDASAMQQAFSAAMLQVLPLLQQSGAGDGDVTMVLQVGHEELARAVSKGNASLVRRGQMKPELVL